MYYDRKPAQAWIARKFVRSRFHPRLAAGSESHKNALLPLQPLRRYQSVATFNPALRAPGVAAKVTPGWPSGKLDPKNNR